MKKYVYGLGALVVPSLVGAIMASGCSQDNGDDNTGGLGNLGQDLCGPCGDIENGDVGISGDARLDGFFKALGNMRNRTVAIQADFDANIRALAATYDVNITGEVNAAVVTQLTTKIKADITANVQGGLNVDYQPPRCQANVNVAVDAQAKCEVKAGCEGEVNPGKLSVSCEGTCSGGCDAECTGEFSCEVEAPSVRCEGQCEGACSLEAAGACNGTCRGDCSGTCSVQNADGSCAGQCDGECQGSCELSVAAECSGTCKGKCLVNQGSAQCTGEASCHGECSGKCTGGCEGNFEPPSAHVDCDASADCQASARAEANASLDCTPPQLKIDYRFAAGIESDIAAQAEFSARLTELRTRGIAIVQGAAQYEALLTGKVEGRTVFATSPLKDLTTSVQGLASANAIARFDIPTGKLACVVPAFSTAGSMLGGMASGMTATIQAQAQFVGAFTSGFES
jgi:hypothetical protein